MESIQIELAQFGSPYFMKFKAGVILFIDRFKKSRLKYFKSSCIKLIFLKQQSE